jgi:hypothetical protein
MRLGIVAEGISDFLVVEAIARLIDANIESERLWPDIAQGGRPYGWRGVKAWCEEQGGRLEILMRGVEGRELDVLVVHVDCSMADKVRADRPCPPARDTADALRAVAREAWLSRRDDLGWLVVVTPAQKTDAWTVAALHPPCRDTARIECDSAVEGELVRRGLLPAGRKPRARYEPLADQVARRFDVVSQVCPEARRFFEELQAALTFVTAGCWD